MTPEEKVKNDSKMRVIFDQTFNLKNEASISALQVIKAWSGYDMPNRPLTTQGDLAELSVIHNEARRGLYLEMRKYISDDVLNEVEIKRRYKDAKRDQK